ncbi:MAG: hypothetical protein PHH75_04135 [Candidatus Omnitrophica bacterium]|nr:hypothetical protein [Candidatus Omnitrophota bacterium]MDD5574347.1 hypothetical protein [Candidatus Omnitrophota bacterium]
MRDFFAFRGVLWYGDIVDMWGEREAYMVTSYMPHNFPKSILKKDL